MGGASSSLEGDFTAGKTKPELGLLAEVRATRVYSVWAVLCVYIVCEATPKN